MTSATGRTTASPRRRTTWIGGVHPERGPAGRAGWGLILIAGNPNVGKSQLLSTLNLQLLAANADVHLIDFTLDDPKRKRLTQYAANLARIEMNRIDFANHLSDPNQLRRYDAALVTLSQWFTAGRLELHAATGRDANGRTVLQSAFAFIRATVEAAARNYPDQKLVVSLDALNNVIVDPNMTDEFVTARLITEKLETLISEFDVLLVATSHLRKNNGRRPELEDLKGNNALSYAAKAPSWDLQRRQAPQRRCQCLLGRCQAARVRRPIVEAHFLKSKVSAFNGCIPFMQWPAWGKVEEAAPNLIPTFLAQSYGKR